MRYAGTSVAAVDVVDVERDDDDDPIDVADMFAVAGAVVATRAAA